MSAKIIGLAQAQAKIRSIGPAVKKTFRELLAQEGRLVAVSLAKSSQPYGTGKEAMDAGQRRARTYIYKVYATKWKAFADINNPALAKAFWLLLQQGHTDRAIKILQAHGRTLRNVPWIRFDGGHLHLANRDAITGRVWNIKVPLAIVRNPAQLKTYIARKQRHVGFGKSAWANIAKVLGGIRGLKTGGDIGAVWITRNTGPGDISWSGSDQSPVLTLTSRVRYAGHILPESQRRIAIFLARERFEKSLLAAVRAETRQLRRAA